MLDEGEKLVPGGKQMRMLQAWWRPPLCQETTVADTRDVTRAYTSTGPCPARWPGRVRHHHRRQMDHLSPENGRKS